jgi:hypothetical protein
MAPNIDFRENPSRIVGGFPVSPNVLPYQVFFIISISTNQLIRITGTN